MSPFVPSLAAGASTSFSVGLSAASAGAYSGAVSFVTGASQDPFSFNISGIVGTELPALDLFCGSRDLTFGQGNVDFGVTVTGMPVTESFTVYNWGAAALALDPDSLILPAGFSLGSSFPSLVAAGEFEQFIIQMDAVADGRFFGQISFNTNAFLNPHLVIQVAGTALAPASQLVVLGPEGALASGGILDLGNTLVGACVTKTLAVANAGTAVLSLDPESPRFRPDSAWWATSRQALSGRVSHVHHPASTLPRWVATRARFLYQQRCRHQPLYAGVDRQYHRPRRSQRALRLRAARQRARATWNSGALSGTPTTVSLTLENQGTAVLCWNRVAQPASPASARHSVCRQRGSGRKHNLRIQLDATAAGSYSGPCRSPTATPRRARSPPRLPARWRTAAASIHV